MVGLNDHPGFSSDAAEAEWGLCWKHQYILEVNYIVWKSRMEGSLYIIYDNSFLKLFMVIYLAEFCGICISFICGQGMIQERNRRFIKSQRCSRVKYYKSLLSITKEFPQSPSILLSNEKVMRSKLNGKVKKLWNTGHNELG